MSADGIIYTSGYVDSNCGIRPALRIANSKKYSLKKGDEVKVAGKNWTALSNSLILCDEVVGVTPFRAYKWSRDSNVYEVSDVKKWLDNWAAENGIEIKGD